MALKKKTSSGSASNDRAAQLAYLKSRQKTLAKSAKKEAPAGYTTREDVIKAFGLKVGKNVGTQAKLTKIVSGMTKPDPKDKKKKSVMYVTFNFVCVGSVGKGQTPSAQFYIAEKETSKGVRTEEQAFDDVIFMMKRCGIDTDDVTSAEDLLNLIDEFNAKDRADKPYVSLGLSVWKAKDGTLGLNVRVNKLLEDFEEEDEEDESDDDSGEDDEDEDEDSEESDDDEDEGDDEEEKPSKKSSKSGSSKSKSAKSKSNSDDDEEDAEEEEEENSDEDSEAEEDDEEATEYDDTDPSTWVGYECKAKPKGYAKTTKFEITEFVKRGSKLKIRDSKGKVVTVSSDDVEVV